MKLTEEFKLEIEKLLRKEGLAPFSGYGKVTISFENKKIVNAQKIENFK